jgi:arsenate reductase-like glutaredoxin family protein
MSNDYNENETDLQLVEVSQSKTSHELLMEAYKKLNDKIDVLFEKRSRKKRP